MNLLQKLQISRIPKKIQREMLEYQNIHGTPEDSIFVDKETGNYIIDFASLRRNDRDLLVMSDAVGDSSFSALQRQWNFEVTAEALVTIFPSLPNILIFFTRYLIPIFVLCLIEDFIGSTVVIVGVLFFIVTFLLHFYSSLYDIAHNEFLGTRYGPDVRGLSQFRRDFGRFTERFSMFTYYCQKIIFNKFGFIIVMILSIKHWGGSNINDVRVFNNVASWIWDTTLLIWDLFITYIWNNI